MMISDTFEPSEQAIRPLDLKALVFDFDGTLVDSEPVWKSTFYDVFFDRHSIEISDKILWENTGNGVDLSVKNISINYDLDLSDYEVLEIASELHQLVEEKILEMLPLRSGAIELFDWARQRNVSMAICTASTPELISKFLNKHRINEYFSAVVSTSTSDLDKRKPYPFPYIESMKKVSSTPRTTIAIEDSPSGVKSARAAGITTIAIHNPFLEDVVQKCDPICQVSDFFQVLELLTSS